MTQEIAAEPPSAEKPLVVAVPQLAAYEPRQGVGRVLTSLQQAWGERVRLEDARFSGPRLPILRNLPAGIDLPADSQLVLLPQITGAYALRGLSRIPSVVVVHDIGVVDFDGDRLAAGWLTRRLIRQSFNALSHAAAIVCVSNFTMTRLLERLPELAERTTVIPNGVDERLLRYEHTRQLARSAMEQLVRRPLAAPLLLYVGSEVPRKNVPALLQALAKVRSAYPEAQLLKVGRPGHPRWRSETVRRAEELGLQVGRDVIILDELDDDDLAHAYRSADVYLSASSYEGFGLPLLEAMAVGTPVVASDIGAHRELVGPRGWLAEPRADALAEAVVQSLSDVRRDERVMAARRQAASLSWGRAAREYLALLGRVAAHR